MAVCTFFGHRECPSEIDSALKDTINELIVDNGVKCFYVGASGEFDRVVFRALVELKRTYDDICIKRVLAYFPKNNLYDDHKQYDVLPEGIETVLPRFAIEYRNNYMLSRADFVVAYNVRDFGGSAKFVKKAKRRGIRVINIADKNNCRG